MKRREYIQTMGMGTGLILCSSGALLKNNKQPNLLFIFPDQMRREAMGFWQNDAFKKGLRTQSDPVVTPVLDKLAEESVVFTQAVSTCPICSPYRAMLMSGMYPAQNGVANNCRHDRDEHLKHDIDCFTDVLASSGYDTCYVGKTHWERNDPLFDEKGHYMGTTQPPGGHHMNPYDTYIPPGRGRHGNDYWFQCVKDDHKDPRVYSSEPDRIEGKTDGQQYRPEIYSPKLEADVLVDYLKNSAGQRNASKPFSVIWAPNPPHNPYASEDDCDEVAYREFYKDQNVSDLLIRPNVAEADKATKERAELSVPFYFANVTGVDKQIGRVFQALEESGEADNTIVVFTADHGEMMGSHNRFGKTVIYEEAFCIPFMIKYPGKTAGTLEDLMLAPVDVMPTVLGLLGLGSQIPKAVEGKNFSHEILTRDWSKTEKPKSALFMDNADTVKGVRTNRYTFQIDHQGKQMLFDNEKDPYQMKELKLSDLPKADADFIVSELGMWLATANDPWFQEKTQAAVIKYPA